MDMMLSLAFFFGWLLSFPFNGPALYALAEFRGFDPVMPGLFFVLFHALGLLGSGLLARGSAAWKKKMTVSAAFSMLLSGSLWVITDKWAWSAIMAILGLISGIFVIGWSGPYIHGIAAPKRVRFMAGTMIAAYLVYIATNLSTAASRPGVSFLISWISLLAALWFTIRCARRGCEKAADAVRIQVPGPLMALLCLTVLILYLNGGLMYNVIFPVFRAHGSWSGYLHEPAYILTLAAAWALAGRSRRSFPVYFGCALLGLAFAAFALLKASAPGFILTAIAFQAGMAFLDLFLWTALADMARAYRRSAAIFGVGLAANVLAIFIGCWTGDLILKNAANLYEVVPIYAWTTISAALFLVPYLRDRFDRDVMSRVFQGLSAAEKDEIELRAIPNSASLTAKESEIIRFMLDGLTNKQIALRMGITENTVKTHLKHVYAKTGLQNKNQLLATVLSTYSR